jgi:hypothetical protein
MRRITAALVMHLVLVAAAVAQQFALDDPPVNPAAPVAGHPVSARLHNFGNCDSNPIAVVRTGNLIELRYVTSNCPILPPSGDFELPLGSLPAGTYDLRIVEITNPQHPLTADEAIFTVQPPSCEPNPGLPFVGESFALCIGGRFSVTAEWSYDGHSGLGRPVALTEDTGAFWFFSDRNLELMVKVLDGCAVNGRFWVYGGGLTDVRVVVRVWDKETNVERTYTNPLGHPFQPIGDVGAFACTAL